MRTARSQTMSRSLHVVEQDTAELCVAERLAALDQVVAVLLEDAEDIGQVHLVRGGHVPEVARRPPHVIPEAGPPNRARR